MRKVINTETDTEGRGHCSDKSDHVFLGPWSWSAGGMWKRMELHEATERHKQSSEGRSAGNWVKQNANRNVVSAAVNVGKRGQALSQVGNRTWQCCSCGTGFCQMNDVRIKG